MSCGCLRGSWTSVSVVLFVCLIIQRSVGLPSRLVCEDGEVACDDGSYCISDMDRCDGIPDCDDRSDEQNCNERCSDNEFMCDDECHPTSRLCDGQPDCFDGSDEQSCPEESSCEPSLEFTCQSDGICINKVQHCDRIPHCLDGSDERDCNYTDTLPPSPTRPSPQPVMQTTSRPQAARCGRDNPVDCLRDGSECIPYDQLCDGHQQCSNGEDENQETCAHYYGIMAPVWVANGHGLVQVNGNSDQPQTKHIGGHVLRIAYDHATSRMFWINSDRPSINVMQVGGTEQKELITTAIDTPTALAYDWVHGVLYWADSGPRHGNAKIEAVVVGSGHRHVLFSSPDVDSPRTLVVDPRPGQGYLYWGQAGQKPCIFQAGLDGSNRRCVANEWVIHPTGMTLDLEENRLLWIDSHQFAVLSWDLMTEKERIVDEFTEADEGLTGIAVFKNWTFWGKASNHSVYRIHKSQKVMHNEAAAKVVVNGLNHPNDIVIYHSLQQPRGQSVCALMNGGCSHICLRSPTPAQRRCVCPNVGALYVLNADKRTCSLSASSSDASTTSGPGGPNQNSVVVSIVIGAFVLFVATVIGAVAD